MSTRPFITLAGNIGSGKTTAAELLAEHLGFELFFEPVVENRFLKPYYADMTRWSFTLQMEFLIKRLEHHGQVDRMRAGCVQDRSLIEDPEIFAKYLHGLGHMTDAELALYYDYFQRLNHDVRQPDALILLHTDDINVLLRRIAARGREEERGITSNFLRGLNHYYEGFAEVARQKYDLPVCAFDVTHVDIRTGEGRALFLERVRGFMSEHMRGGQLEFPAPR